MNWCRLVLMIVAALSAVSTASAETGHATGVPAAQALIELKEGAERFALGQSAYPHQDSERIQEIVAGQHPYATILSCSDSRVPVEMIFDAGFGDLFVIRVAGNIIAPNQTGTIEYGIEHLGSNLIVVLGHSKCGAVTAASGDVHAEGAVASILDEIAPAVKRCREAHPAVKGSELVSAAIRENVWLAMESLLARSPLVRERVANGSVQLVGAIYNLEDTKVEWLGRHPREKELLALPVVETAQVAEPLGHSPVVVGNINAGAASSSVEAQLLAFRKELDELKAQSRLNANDSTLTALALAIGEIKAWVNNQSGRNNRNQPSIAAENGEVKH